MRRDRKGCPLYPPSLALDPVPDGKKGECWSAAWLLCIEGSSLPSLSLSRCVYVCVHNLAQRADIN